MQVCLSIYDLLLTPGIKELSMKEVAMYLPSQKYKSAVARSTSAMQ